MTVKHPSTKRRGRPPKYRPAIQDTWASILVQLPLPIAEIDGLNEAFEDSRGRPDIQVRLHRVIQQIVKFRALIEKLDKPGVGLSAKWRSGTIAYYMRVLDAQTEDLAAILLEIQDHKNNKEKRHHAKSRRVSQSPQ